MSGGGIRSDGSLDSSDCPATAWGRRGTPCRSRFPPFQRLHSTRQRKLSVGDGFGQFAQRSFQSVEQTGQFGPEAVGVDGFEVGRVETAQPGADPSTNRCGRDEPVAPGSARKSSLIRSSW